MQSGRRTRSSVIPARAVSSLSTDSDVSRSTSHRAPCIRIELVNDAARMYPNNRYRFTTSGIRYTLRRINAETISIPPCRTRSIVGVRKPNRAMMSSSTPMTASSRPIVSPVATSASTPKTTIRRTSCGDRTYRLVTSCCAPVPVESVPSDVAGVDRLDRLLRYGHAGALFDRSTLADHYCRGKFLCGAFT